MRAIEYIQALVYEAHEKLASAGYDQLDAMEPIEDPLDGIVGCTVTAKAADGRSARESVFYPEDWQEETR